MDMSLFKKALFVFELLAGIIGLVHWRNIKNSYWRYFPFYLIFLAILETSTYFVGNSIVKYINTFILIPAEFLFFFWLFYQNSQKKRFIFIGVFVYLLSFFIEVGFAEKVKSGLFLSFPYSVGNLILLIFILQYFYKLIYSDRILFFYRERMFWVALGLLIFFLGTFPYFGLYNLMLTKHFDLLVTYTWVEIFLNYTMYLLFAASFIWGKEK
jgi:hypothetical protein